MSYFDESGFNDVSDDVIFSIFNDIQSGDMEIPESIMDSGGLEDILSDDLFNDIELDNLIMNVNRNMAPEIRQSNIVVNDIKIQSERNRIDMMMKDIEKMSMETRKEFLRVHSQEMTKLFIQYNPTTANENDESNPKKTLVMLDFINGDGVRTMNYPRKLDVINNQNKYNDIHYLHFKNMRVINPLTLLDGKKKLKFDTPRNEGNLNPIQKMSSYDHVNLINYSLLQVHERILRKDVTPIESSGDTEDNSTRSQKYDVTWTTFRGIINFIRDGVTNVELFDHLKEFGFTSEDYTLQILKNMKEGKLTNYFSLNSDVIDKDLMDELIKYHIGTQTLGKVKEDFEEKVEMFSGLYPNSLKLYDVLEDFIRKNIFN